MFLKRTSLMLFICYNLSINSMDLPSLIAGMPMVYTIMCGHANSFNAYKIFNYPFTEPKIMSTSFSKITMYSLDGIRNNPRRSCINLVCLIANFYFVYKAYKKPASDIHKIYNFSACMFHFALLITMPAEYKDLNIKVEE